MTAGAGGTFLRRSALQAIGRLANILGEALRYLGSEGLVDLTPQRGALVGKFSAKDVEDMLASSRSTIHWRVGARRRFQRR